MGAAPSGKKEKGNSFFAGMPHLKRTGESAGSIKQNIFARG
jgi:hypothetical protein